jgi:hypothetical protein
VFLGNGSQQWRFICSHVYVFDGWLSFHNELMTATPSHDRLTSVSRWVKLLLGFASTVISAFSLLETHNQEFYSLLDMYVFRNEALSSRKEGSVRLDPSLYGFGTDRIENIASDSSSNVACIASAAETCLSSRWLPSAASSGATISPFRYHVTVYSYI